MRSARVRMRSKLYSLSIGRGIHLDLVVRLRRGDLLHLPSRLRHGSSNHHRTLGSSLAYLHSYQAVHRQGRLSSRRKIKLA